MKSRTILLFSFVVTFLSVSLRPKAQTTSCDCWQQRDASFQLVPFGYDFANSYIPVASNYYRNDDATYVLNLPFSFCFYGSSINQIVINNNGYVTFGADLASNLTWDPVSFPRLDTEMIAPFWGDVDTRIADSTGDKTNTVWYKVTSSYIIIQWDSVCFYQGFPLDTNYENTFQVIISNGNNPIIPNGNNVEFCYGTMQWAVALSQFGTNGFNGSVPSVVGENLGNGATNIQFGLFNTATANYTDPYPASPYDGLFWLNNRQLLMNVCPGNAPPVQMSGLPPCDTASVDTVKVCEGDTATTSFSFYSVISNTTVQTVLATPVLSGVSFIYNNVSGASDSIVVQVIGNSSNTGIHTVGLYSFDNISPADTLYTRFIVDVLQAPSDTITTLKDTICTGGSSVLSVSGAETYSWSTGATTSSITVSPTTTQQYTVLATSMGCPPKDDSITIVVEPITAITVTPADTGICAGNSVTLSASGGTAYKWSPGNGLSCTSCSSPLASPIVTTTYTVANAGNCSPPVTAVVNIYPIPSVTIAATDTICAGSSSTITATGGLTYLWSTGATTSAITVFPSSNQTYGVQVTGTGNCTKDTSVTITVEPVYTITVASSDTEICVGNSVILTASGGIAYNWSPGAGLSCTSCSSPVASPTVTTVYTVTSSANNCSAPVTDTVNVYSSSAVSVTPSADSVCRGNSVTLSASGDSAYSWSPSSGLSCTDCSNPAAMPTVSTVYTVVGTSAQGCTSTTTVSVSVSPLPVLNLSPNQHICGGNSVTLVASGNGNGYLWTPGNDTTPSITVTPGSTETFVVTMSNACGNVSDSVTVFIIPQPVPSISVDLPGGCAPLCVQFFGKSTTSSGAIISWYWNFGNGDTSAMQNPVYCYRTPGQYSTELTVVSDSSCSNTTSFSDFINVYTPPGVAFSASPQPTTFLQPTIQFTNETTDVYGISYWFWTFGDGTDSTSNFKNPVHTYRDTGTFCVRLFATNAHGCADSAVNCVVISPIYTLYIPDAFTPNGDGLNDVFAPKGNDIKSFEMYIFDRRGMELFHTTDINEGWNGRLNGTGPVWQEDTYAYVITVYDSKNNKHTYNGTVILIK